MSYHSDLEIEFLNKQLDDVKAALETIAKGCEEHPTSGYILQRALSGTECAEIARKALEKL